MDSTFPAAANYELLKTTVEATVAKLKARISVTEDPKLCRLFSVLRLALEAASQRVKEDAEVNSDPVRNVKLVHDMAEALTHAKRPESISSFLKVHFEDLVRVLMKVPTVDSNTKELQGELAEQCSVLLREIGIQAAANGGPTNITNNNHNVLGNVTHNVVHGTQHNTSTWAPPDPNLFFNLNSLFAPIGRRTDAQLEQHQGAITTNEVQSSTRG